MKQASRNILLSLAARNGWQVRQGDFENAFLNGVLSGEGEYAKEPEHTDVKDAPTQPIYVEQAPGFEVKKPNGEELVCLLIKALYGLKQASRIWYQTLAHFLILLGFTRYQSDHAVFYRNSEGRYLYVGVHVDDPLIVNSDVAEGDVLERRIQESYGYNPGGEIHHYLGARYTRDWTAGTISANQAVYIDAAVNHFGLQDSRPVSSPLVPGLRIGKEYCPKDASEIARMRKVPYRELVGLLLYIASRTRPDISYAVSILGQVAHNPGRIHWEAAKRVVRYLKGTHNWCMTWGRLKTGLVGYTDAGYGSEDLGWRSMSGYAFVIDGGAISWSAKKQEVIALSTAESEYIAMTHAAKELMWIRTFLSEILRPMDRPVTLQADNNAAICLAKNDVYHPRTKHIALRYHYIREVVGNREAILKWVPSELNSADIFTKALDAPKTATLAASLGLFKA
jgi:hypothetical protein